MKRVTASCICLFIFYTGNAQNVGIGTNNPTATLEIKKSTLSSLKISSESNQDTSQVILSNRSNQVKGTDMLINSIRETGLLITSKSDLSANTHDSILSISPQGMIGINKLNPAENLDVNGSINYSQSLKVNGSAGAQGQVLSVNSAGGNEWVDIGDYKYSRMVTVASPTTILVPVGVTRMVIEQWAGGGGGGTAGGGGSGSYGRFTFNTSLVNSFVITNGTGGANIGFSGNDGTNGTITVNTKSGGTLTYSTAGGTGTQTTKVGQATRPLAYNLGTVLIGFLGMPGKSGKIIHYEGSFMYGGDGGDAVLGLAEGGTGSQVFFNGNIGESGVYSSNGTGLYSSGGGGGWNEIPIIARGAAGGDGVTVVRW